MTDSFTVRFQVTPSAVIDAVRLHQKTLMARLRAVLVIFVAAGGVIAMVVDLTLGLSIAFFGILLLALSWFQFLDRWLIGNRGRGIIGETCEYIADDQGLRYEHPLGSGVINWSALTDVRTNDKSIVFRRDRVMAAYLPTSAFATPAERDSFLAFARAHVGATDEADNRTVS